MNFDYSKRVIMFLTLAHKISYMSGRLIKVALLFVHVVKFYLNLSDNKLSIYLAYQF